MSLRRWGAVVLATALLGGISVAPALAAEPVLAPKVTVYVPTTGVDPAGTEIIVKGTGFDPAANGGKGYGLRVGPDKAGLHDKLAKGFQVSKLIKKDPAGIQIPLNDNGTWEAVFSVKAEYVSDGVTYSAKTQPFSVFVFGYDNPELTWDSRTPLKFNGIGDPEPPASGNVGLHWGLKKSWRTYITSFGGSITPSRGLALDQAPPNNAPYPYVWPTGKSTWDGTKGTVNFGGQVDYVLEPHMIWDFGFANPKVTFAGDGTGTLSATVNYSFYGTKTAPKDVRRPAEVVFANLKFKGAPKQDGDNVVADIETAKLTEAGAGAFAGFYQADEPLDLGQVVFPGKAGTVDPPTTSPPTTPPTTDPTSAPPSACVFDPAAIKQGNLLWGLKKSLRQYVGVGIGGQATGNSIVASGGAEITAVDEVLGAGKPNPAGIPTGAYRFGFTSAKYTSPGEFTAQYQGTVTFSYPAHSFTLIVGNPKVVVAQGKGTLYADVELKTTAPGKLPVNSPGVALANLDLTAAKTAEGGGVVAVSAIKTTLTSADAFAGFYQAGDVLDEATATLGAGCAQLPGAGGGSPGGQAGTGGGQDLVPDLAFRPESGLASTGATLSPLFWGLLLLVGGAGLVMVSRRHAR